MTRAFLAIAFITLLVGPAYAADPVAVEFFESKIRPLLADNCYSCHGNKKQSAGLRLDTALGLKNGVDDGPVIIIGKPGESKLLAVVQSKGDDHMPPKGQLTVAQIADLTKWIEAGAVFPESAEAKPKIDAKSHWAFKPIASPPVPAVKAATAVDAFLVQKLTEKGLAYAPPADKRVLIRRAYYDLLGLPPTFDEVETFVNDESPTVFANLIDRMLASPQYGERYARHWLDLARYSDTKGYVFTETRDYPYAYTYRDYTIKAFNDDKPFNRFIIEQLAADKLDLKGDNHPLAALGYLTLGRRFLNNTHDIIDDRIDVVTRGFMGLSVGCARCHDHKFDPIPIKDYYSLYGVFASTMEPKDLPVLDGHAEATAASIAFEAELAKKQKAAADFATSMYAEAMAPFRTRESIATYLLAVRDCRGKNDKQLEAFATERKLDGRILDRWRAFLSDPARRADPIFTLWFALLDASDAQFGESITRILDSATADPPILTEIAEQGAANFADLCAVYGRVLSTTHQTALTATNAPTNPPPEMADKYVMIATKQKYRTLRNEVTKFQSNSPAAPPRAMVINDTSKPFEPVVFLRGNPANRGAKVPRQFLEVVAGSNRKSFTDGSGRLELANAIASKDNPLTARVIVNRIWTWHFGRGLVTTPSDFGVRSDLPSHPELLDYLASKFVTEDNWSLKKLHRRILLTSAYQQSSFADDNSLAKDPENVLLSRSPRTRLDYEGVRDSLLAVAGTLDVSTIGGRPVDLTSSPRRTIYGRIDRQNVSGTARAFDFANPDQHSPQRFQTTVPQQSLFLLNSPFVADAATKLAKRVEVAKTPSEKVKALYRAVYGRKPTNEEIAIGVEFVEVAPSATGGQLVPWAQFAQVLLLSNEFAFVD